MQLSEIRSGAAEGGGWGEEFRRASVSKNAAVPFMENNTSLTLDSLKIVISDYARSFSFVLKNKWLYLIALFFSLVGSLYSIGMQLYYRFTSPDFYRNQFIRA